MNRRLRDGIVSVLIGILIGIPWSLYAISTIKGPKVVTVTEKVYVPITEVSQMEENEFDFYLESMKSQENRFYEFMDKEVAEDLLAAVKVYYPDAIMVEMNDRQYIAITEEASKELQKYFEACYTRYSEKAIDSWYKAREISEMCKKNG